MKKFLKVLFYVFLAIVALVVIGNLSKDEKESSKIEVQTGTENQNLNCDYSKVTIKVFALGTDKVINEKTLNACFNVKKMEFGMIEISSKETPVKVIYYNEIPMKFLNVKLTNDDPVQWRKNKGHDIFKIEKNGKLTFIFSDKTTMKGTIVFE